MKLLTLFTVILFTSFSFFHENINDKCSVKPFEVYLENEENYTEIRNKPDGEIMFKINNEFSEYILTVVDFKEGWFKVNRLSEVGGEYKITELNGWINSSFVRAGTTHNLEVVDKPNGKTIVGKLKGERDQFKISDVDCEWIFIECNTIAGWVKSEKICGNPVTTCP